MPHIVIVGVIVEDFIFKEFAVYVHCGFVFV